MPDMCANEQSEATLPTGNIGKYNRFLLFVAGMGGLLYGVDVGIIAGALPYLEATSKLNSNQLSLVVAAVLLGSVLSTLFAGTLANCFGRKRIMTVSGVVFVISIPIIALSEGLGLLVSGRLLQGISAGLIGVTVPLYLAECLSASARGKGTAMFQWLLTLGIVAAAAIAMYFSIRIENMASLNDAASLFAFKDRAWRGIFWASLPAGIIFVIGSLMVEESPRWLFGKGRKTESLAALKRSRPEEQALLELKEMEERSAISGTTGSLMGAADSLFQRKYILPFVMACVVLVCTQATGAASIVGYNTTILIQAGLSDLEAHWGYVILTSVNFIMTIGGVALVDRKGRKFLLSLGTAGIIVSLVGAGILFMKVEKARVDCRDAVQGMVTSGQTLKLSFNSSALDTLIKDGKTKDMPHTLTVIYSYGDFRATTSVARSDDPTGKPIEVQRADCVPPNRIVAFFANPFASLEAARSAPLKIENALITPLPDRRNGILTALCLFVFMASFAIGPGVCVWLALSELMPTRIRSNGMSIALLLNQAVSTTIAAVFLPTVGKYGYAAAFFVFAGFTIIYFLTAAFFLPETKGKTLEEIEEYFESRQNKKV